MGLLWFLEMRRAVNNHGNDLADLINEIYNISRGVLAIVTCELSRVMKSVKRERAVYQKLKGIRVGTITAIVIGGPALLYASLMMEGLI